MTLYDDKGMQDSISSVVGCAPGLVAIGSLATAVMYLYGYAYALAFCYRLGVKPEDIGVTQPVLIGWSVVAVIAVVAVGALIAYLIGIAMFISAWAIRRLNLRGEVGIGGTRGHVASPKFRLPTLQRFLRLTAGGILVCWLVVARYDKLALIGNELLIIGVVMLVTTLFMGKVSGKGSYHQAAIWLPMLAIVLFISSADAGATADQVRADKPEASIIAPNLGLDVQRVVVTPVSGRVPGLQPSHAFMLLGGTDGVYMLWDATEQSVLRFPKSLVVVTQRGWS